MKDDTRWKLLLGTALVAIALFLTVLHYLIFQDLHHISIYFLGDLAFIPVEVLCVTLLIDQLLESREKQQRLEKLNMVIGVFFTHIGTPLLARLAKADPCSEPLKTQMAGGPEWSPERFRTTHATLSGLQCKVDPTVIDREALKEFLTSNENFILRIMENPTIFEHESFTDLIFAVTHLMEELSARDDLRNLPLTDIAHLEVDMERIYSRLVPEWLKYMEYLKNHYPYLFSLAMRQNPFDENASVVIV
jgi:hypothetical protein